MKTRIIDFGAGAISAAGALLLVYTITTIIPSITYPPIRVASLFIAIVPGDFATAAIERLGHGAILSVSLGVNAGALVAGGFAGVFVRRVALARGRARRALAIAAILLIVAVVLNVTSPEGWSALATFVYAGAALLFARWTAGAELLAAIEPVAGPGETPLDAISRSRRRFIVRAVTLSAVIIGGGGAFLRMAGQRAGELGRILQARKPFVPPPQDLTFPGVAGISKEITPTEEFYNVDINIIKPSVDAAKWRLRIHGEVQNEFSLDYGSLQNDFEIVEMAHTLTCISNEVGGDLISTAVWTGVRLKDVLARAEVRAGVVDLIFRAAEGYSDSIPLAKALEATTLVVFGMNGETLPRKHGYPARIIVPGIYGMKNVKWLTEIEATTQNYQGYWMVRGWSDVARVKTSSRIDAISGAVAGGVAWAGDRRISEVEVSTNGSTWRPARLKRELAPLTWRLWAADLEDSDDSKTLLVRATDGSGEVQTARIAKPHPDGSSGYDSQSVKLG